MEGYQLSLLPLMQSDVPLAANIVQIKDAGFQNALEEWAKTDRFGFDIETFPKVPNGNAAELKTGEIRCIQIAYRLAAKRTKVIFLDLGWQEQEREQTCKILADLGVWQLLEERLKNPAVEVVGHSLEFEQKWMLACFGFVLRNLRDVKLASQIYWAGLDPWLEQINGKPHSLASICCRLNLPVDKTKQKSSWGWGDLEGGKLSNAQINYATKDAEVVLEVGDILMPLLQEIGVANSYLIECAASPGFAQMSHFGMPANKSKSSAIASAYKSACADLIKRLNSSFPEAVPHLFSPKKLTAAINAKFKLNLADSNAEQLAERWSIPEIRLISVIKTAKTYCDYVGSLEEKTDENGFVHPEFAQITRLGFGRAAARNPNVQNPPNPANFPAELSEYELPAIRSAFAPPPGKALIACDLSKIHTRIACEASQDPHLKAIFNSESQNIFAPISAKIARIQGMDAGWNEGNLTRWKQDKSHPNHHLAASLYALAKTVHYASLNLSGTARIRSIIGLAGNHREIALEEARLLVGAWRQTYPVLARFQRELTDRASNCLPPVLGISSIAAKSRFGLGYVRCITGRGTYLPKWPNNNSRQPSVRGPDACAASWTLAEADIVKLAIGLCVEKFDANPDWEAHLANVCHDELLAVCESDRALDVANCLLECTNAAVGTFIKSIAVSETVQPGQLICSDWSQK